MLGSENSEFVPATGEARSTTAARCRAELGDARTRFAIEVGHEMRSKLRKPGVDFRHALVGLAEWTVVGAALGQTERARIGCASGAFTRARLTRPVATVVVIEAGEITVHSGDQTVIAELDAIANDFHCHASPTTGEPWFFTENPSALTCKRDMMKVLALLLHFAATPHAVKVASHKTDMRASERIIVQQSNGEQSRKRQLHAMIAEYKQARK